MARLPRLAVAGQAHLALMRGHSAQPVFADDDDRRLFLAALREASLQHGVAVHAWALRPGEVLLLLTPATDGALGSLMQGLGRRYGAAFNRRHGRSGTLWAGRFRTAVVQAGVPLLEALQFVESPWRDAGLADTAAGAWTSGAHHQGRLRDPLINECSAWWSLGNTPFEREAVYQRLLAEGLPSARHAALDEAVRQGWAVGDAGFLAELASRAQRPVRPRPRGRPVRGASSGGSPPA